MSFGRSEVARDDDEGGTTGEERRLGRDNGRIYSGGAAPNPN